MTTPESHSRIQPLFIAAYGAFVSAIAIFIGAFIFTLPEHLFKALLFLSASFTAFGTGEFLNHPKQKLITPETVKTSQKPKYHHNRNPCILGNVFGISGLILMFIALSAFFFPH